MKIAIVCKSTGLPRTVIAPEIQITPITVKDDECAIVINDDINSIDVVENFIFDFNKNEFVKKEVSANA